MHNNQRTFSRELIVRVNQGFIEHRRVDMTPLPSGVKESIRATTFSREQLTQSFANARRRVTSAA